MQSDRLLSSVFAVTVILFLSSTALAAGGYFGVQERIRCLQPINEDAPRAETDPSTPPPIFKVTDLNHVNYELCYKYSILFVFAGVYLHDDGYVLAEGDDAFRYLPLDAAKIAEYQSKGILPRDLPPYTIAWSQYAVGYSLWFILVISFVGVAGWLRFKRWMYRGRKCAKCELDLIDNDFKTGRCSSCGEPVPQQPNRTSVV